MLNKKQIILLQTAVRKAGIRTAAFDGRYRLLLRQYLQPSGEPVTTCRQLNDAQLDDLLGICEAHGWQMPGKDKDYFREKLGKRYDTAGYAQQAAIKYLAADLGMEDYELNKFIKRMTGSIDSIAALSPKQAYKITEALKAILTRKTGMEFKNLREIKNYYKNEGATDGQEKN